MPTLILSAPRAQTQHGVGFYRPFHQILATGIGPDYGISASDMAHIQAAGTGVKVVLFDRDQGLQAEAVLLDIRRAVVAIKRKAREQTRHERGKLILRRRRNERIFDGRIHAECLQIERRREQRVIDADEGRARMKDPVATAQNQPAGIERRVSEAHARTKVVRVEPKSREIKD